MRKILVTNDDGIRADGLVRLAEAAAKFGEVTVIAPDDQRSAMSHRITLREPIDVWKVDFPVAGVTAYASTGTPADCVRFGLLNFVPYADLVLSGINFGYNSGTDIQYSATVGAALEAANVGVHAIAVSEGFDEMHTVSKMYLEPVLAELIERPLGRDLIWNVNFPSCRPQDYRGILEDRTIAHNGFYHDSYDQEFLPDGRIRLRVAGEYFEDAEPGTDVRAIIDGYISIGIVRNLHE